MSDDDPEFDRKAVVRLILGFLPLDVELVLSLLHHIKGRASETSWSETFRRIASLGLVFFQLSAIGVLAAFYFGNELDSLPVETIGWGYSIAIAVLIFICVLYYILQLIQTFNRGDSPIFTHQTSLYVGLLEILFGLIVFAPLVYLSFQMRAVVDLVVISLIGIVVLSVLMVSVGLFVAGILELSNFVQTESSGSTPEADDSTSRME